MTKASQALIVGGGIAGMSCGMTLRRIGWRVDLIDVDPQWRSYGAGITVTGPTLRAFRDLGILDEVLREGAATQGLRIFSFDGTPIGEGQDPGSDDGIPPNGGIMRPKLHEILARATIDSGVQVRLGVRVTEISDERDDTIVSFSDGSSAHYGLIVGADGANSRMRSMMFPDAPAPKFTGQGSWRTVARRPSDMSSLEVYLGATVKAGLVPVSSTHMYMFTLSPEPGDPFYPPESWPDRLSEVLTGFGGRIAAIRDNLQSENTIVYRPLHSQLLPDPWHRGRAIIIGDAAHTTTPHLACGAGMAVEDALVLTELLKDDNDLARVFPRFMERRFDRCRLVVEVSRQTGEMELTRAPVAQQMALYGATMARLAEPI